LGIGEHGAKSMEQRASSMPHAPSSMLKARNLLYRRFQAEKLETLNLKLETIQSWEWIK